MTGASSGLGKISALKAANMGATLIALVRSQEKGELLKTEYAEQFPNGLGSIITTVGNLNSFASIHKVCQQLNVDFPVIDMVVNNAGIMNFEPKNTEDGIEETLQVNLLSPVLITLLLIENLKKASDPKIIFTSSGLHQGDINFEDLEFKNSFSSFKVYRQSKLGVILMCKLLSQEFANDHIHFYAQHPGVVRTNLGQSAGWFSKLIFYLMGKSPEKGSQTLSYLIETDSKNLESGAYYANKKVTKTTPQSYDMVTAQKLFTAVKTYLNPFVSES